MNTSRELLFKKKVLIIGETKLCIQCIEHLLRDNSWEIVSVISNDRTVVKWCNQNSILVLPFASLAEINNNKFYFFSIANPHVIPESFFQQNKITLALNYHDSLLPRYAGVNSTTWAIINGEKTHGVTLHCITSAIDAGDIALQSAVPIEENETTISLNLKCSESLLTLFQEAINRINTGTLSTFKQNILNRTYYGLRHIPENYGLVNGIEDLATLDKLVRGLTFGEGYVNSVASVKIFVNDRFYILEDPNRNLFKSGKFKEYVKENVFNTALDIYGHKTNMAITPTLLSKPYRLSQDDLSYISNVKMLEPKYKQQISEFIDKADASRLILNHAIGSDSLDDYTKDIIIADSISNSMALTIIYIVLVRFFHEDFILSLYNFDETIPRTLKNLVEKRHFIRASRNTLAQSFTELTDSLNQLKDNCYLLMKDFGYRHHLSLLTDIAITFHRTDEHIDRHKMYINIEGRALKISGNSVYQLQINSIANCLGVLLDKPIIYEDLSTISLLTDTEYQKIVYGWNKTEMDSPTDKTIHQLFEEQVIKTPNNIAVVYENIKLTYNELNIRANQLAHYLKSTYTIKADDLIALCVDRSEAMIIAILAVLKSGAAYVPLDPDYPMERIRYILEDTRPKLLITNERHAQKMVSFCKEYDLSLDIFMIDNCESQIHLFKKLIMNPQSSTKSNHLAYTMYTSGTTGSPKGVMVEHVSVVNTIFSIRNIYTVVDNSKTTFFCSYVFDVSVAEMMGPLLNGCELHILSNELRKDVSLLSDYLLLNKIQVCYLPPALLSLMKRQEYPDLINVMYAGEPCDKETGLYWSKQKNLFNYYGPTEASIYCLGCKIMNGQIHFIGKPIHNAKAYILDGIGNPVPIGAAGELYIGGIGVARGYLNLPDLTKEKFINNPFQSDEERFAHKNNRLYKTGDWVRYSSDGNVEYIGRDDGQLKIRGFRVEPGEIEAILLLYPNIKQAIVVAKTHETDSYSHNNKYIAAYYVSDIQINEEILLNYLEQRLPNYMVPAALMNLKQLPLTLNGKVDRNALPEPKLKRNVAYSAPRHELDVQLCAIYAEVLSLNSEQISIYDSFFKLGGDSILAIKLANRLKADFNRNITVKNVFEAKNVSNLSDFIAGSKDGLEVPEEYVKFSLINLNKDFLLDDNVEDIYPASYLQAGMLLESELHSEKTTYHNLFCYMVNKPFNESKFREVWNHLTQKHELLRARFVKSTVDGYNAIVKKKLDYIQIIIHRAADIETLVNQERNNPVNCAKTGLFRLIVNNLNEKFSFIFSSHHSINDGWSVTMLINEFAQAYVYDKPIKPLVSSLCYGQFVKHELAIINNTFTIDFWKEYLDEVSAPNIKWNFTNAKSKNALLGASFSLSSEESQGILRLANKNEVSVDSVFLWAYIKTLAFLLNNDDITIGLVVNNRPEQKGGEELFGLFVNTIPFRVKLNEVRDNDSGIQLAFDTKVKIRPYKHMPYGHIKSMLGHDLYSFVFNFTNFDVLQQRSDAIVKLEEYVKTNIPFVLSVNRQNGNDFKLEISVSDEYVDSDYLEYFVKYLKISLQDIIYSRNKMRLDEVDFNKLIYTFDNPRLDCNRDKTIQQLFEEQVEKTPHRIAIVYENIKLTYEELNAKANQLANYLRNIHPIHPEDLIALCVDRTETMVIAILAVLKSGAAYVPIDPAYPLERIHYILKDTKTKLLIANEHHVQRISPFFKEWNLSLEVVRIDNSKLQACLSQESIASPELGAKSYHLAYVMYTSGTTGHPKGVAIEHRGVLNTVFAIKNIYTAIPNSKVGFFCAYVFDVSVSEMMATLLNGCELHILSNELRKDANLLSDYLLSHKIQVCYLPPAILSLIKRQAYPDLINLIYAGEPCDKETALYWSAQKNLFNYYGPTETSIYCSGCKIIDGQVHLIGKPIQNTKAYILDDVGRLLPIGAVGELYIGGIGVARGYLNLPELTQNKFIKNPFQTKEEKEKNINDRLYKTGDLVRYRPDLNLEYMGRNDSQVKIRGFRVEIAEIEAVLYSYPQVKQAVVLAVDEGQSNKYFIGYYVADYKLDESTLFRYLNERLPEYMIPTILVYLSSLPLTTNGKLDKSALLKMELRALAHYVAPVTKCEKQICSIITRVLGKKTVTDVGKNDSFFMVGGDSLSAIKLLNEINIYFDVQLKIADIFKAKTVEKIADLVSHFNPKFEPITKFSVVHNNKPDLFIVHSAFSGIEIYAPLADKLSSRFNCYGIENYNLYHEEKMTDLNQLALYYLYEIDEVRAMTKQSEQPYLLLGWSLGGQIALEMASILERKGCQSIKLILLDPALTDNQLSYYYGDMLKIDNALFRQFLESQDYEENLINKIITNISSDIQLARQTTDTPLLYSEAILFKAMQYGTRKYFNNYKFQSDYVLELYYNNIDKIIDASNIELVKMQADHFTLLDQVDILYKNIVSWYSSSKLLKEIV